MSGHATRVNFLFSPVQATRRCGIKGADAAALLLALQLPVPPRPNSVVSLAPPLAGRCLRLGSSEFLLEQDGAAQVIDRVEEALRQTATRAHAALRCDSSYLLGGDGLYAALRQVAAFDFERLPDTPGQVVMTLLAGVSVTFIAAGGADPALRLWCDSSFGEYLRDCLLSLGGEPSHSLTPVPLPHTQGTPA